MQRVLDEATELNGSLHQVVTCQIAGRLPLTLLELLAPPRAASSQSPRCLPSLAGLQTPNISRMQRDSSWTAVATASEPCARQMQQGNITWALPPYSHRTSYASGTSLSIASSALSCAYQPHLWHASRPSLPCPPTQAHTAGRCCEPAGSRCRRARGRRRPPLQHRGVPARSMPAIGNHIGSKVRID